MEADLFGTALRRRVKVLGLVEGRVRRDQIDAIGVHGPEEIEIVALEQRSVFPVRLAYFLPDCPSFSVPFLPMRPPVVEGRTVSAGYLSVKYIIPYVCDRD